MPSDSITAVAGPAGVGALCILGMFLFFDGRAPELFPTVETYAKTATWGIVAAVPVLVMAYVLGLFLISGAVLAIQLTFGLGFEQEATDIARLAAVSAEKSAAVQTYVQLRQDRAVLAGSAVAFVVLFAGAMSEIRNLSHLKGTIILLGVGVLLLAIVMFYLACRKSSEAHRLAEQVAVFAPAGGSVPSTPLKSN
jgi:hypothetical protein